MSNSAPEGWKVQSLAEVAKFVMGQAPAGADCNKEGIGIPFVKAGEFKTKYPVIREWTTAPHKLAKSGDVLICVVGATAGKLNLGIDCAIGRSVAAIRPEKTSTLYLYNFMQQHVERLRTGSSGSAQGVITTEHLKNIVAPFPPLPEQQKIATILSSVDDVIEKTRAQIDKLKDLKTGMGQELLTKGIGHTEFKDSPVGRIPTGWDYSTLDDVASIQTGVAKNSKAIGDMVEVPYLRVANVQDGYLDLSEVKSIKIERSRLDRFSLQKDDVLVNEGGDFDKLGRGAVWDSPITPCVHQNHVFVVRTDNSQLLPSFFNYLSGSQHGKKYYLGCAKQTTNLASLNSSQLRAFPVLLPPLSEQQSICEVLASIDQKIAVCVNRMVANESLKNALMQDLLTGKVRVKTEEKEKESAVA